MPQIIAITGASSGFGALIAQTLVKAGYIVFAGMRDMKEGSVVVKDNRAFAQANEIDIRPIEINVVKDSSIEAAVAQIIKEAGRLDVLIHNAGQMAFGPLEAFTPEQLALEYDITTSAPTA